MELTRREFTHAIVAGVSYAAWPRAGRARLAERPPLGRFHYTVTRDGSPIGTHVRTLRQAEGVLVVETEIDLSVELLTVSLYRYSHRAVERWRSGTLIGLDSETVKNGTAKRLRGARGDDGILTLENHKGEQRRFEASPIATTLWHPATPEADQLLEVEDGWMKRNVAQQVGLDAVPVGDERREARHYRLGGEVDREVWYDARGLLVRVAFRHDDGSKIVMTPAQTFT